LGFIRNGGTGGASSLMGRSRKHVMARHKVAGAAHGATAPAIAGARYCAVPLALLLAGCMLGPDYKTPEAQVASQWPTDQLISARAFDAADAYWWKAFNDPTLNALIEAAFRNNPSLQVAGVRVLAARAQLNQSIGNLFPQQQAIGGGVTRYNTTTSSASRTPVSGALSPDYSTDQLLFSASWELDFWGKYRRTIESERASYLGTVASYDDALVTLVADVASSYVNIRTAEERLRVAVRNADIQRESLRVATVQYKFGETSELDVRQATTLLGQTEAQIPRLQNTLNQARNGLAVQLGVAPDHVDNFLTGPSDIPSAPAQIAVGIPKDLLRRRPDVRAAGLSAASQSALIGVAKANMYPAFSLSGVFGYTSNNVAGNSLGDIFQWQNRVTQVGASFVWPVFNYGRLVNQVRVQDASFEQAILNYQNTVLSAQAEVENGISAYRTEQQALDNLSHAADAARRSTALSMVQYKSGEADYTTVLSTEQAQLSVEDSVASARGNVLLGMIGLYRALGGGWELREGHDVISDDVRAEMARRTDWGSMLEPAHHIPGKQPEEEQ